MIHATAIVDCKSSLGRDVRIGPYSVVEEDCQIGDDTIIRERVSIERFTTLGARVSIFQGAIVGSKPQDVKFKGEGSSVTVGNGSTIREYVTINRATEGRSTIIGHDTLIMAYSHVAHDCILGDRVTVSNAVNMAGHIWVGDDVTIGGMVPIHQFVRIGRHAMVAGGYRVVKDVPPFVLAAGEPLRFYGLNTVGLRRRGFSDERINQIDKAYRILYRSGRLRSQALCDLATEFPDNHDVADIIEFFRQSRRGVIGR